MIWVEKWILWDCILIKRSRFDIINLGYIIVYFDFEMLFEVFFCNGISSYLYCGFLGGGLIIIMIVLYFVFLVVGIVSMGGLEFVFYFGVIFGFLVFIVD